MSNETLKRVFNNLLKLTGKDGKPGYILCLAIKDKDEITEDIISHTSDIKPLNEVLPPIFINYFIKYLYLGL